MYRAFSYQTFRAHVSLLRRKDCQQCVSSTLSRGNSDVTYTTSSSQEVTEKEANRQCLDCNDYRKAYEFRTTPEIARALFVFKLCSYQIFVKHSLKLMSLGKTILGERLFTKIMTSTFSGQFIGGETTDDLLQSVAALRKGKIGPLLCIPIEEDVGYTEYRRETYDDNLDALLQCATLATKVDPAYPMSQMKLTALVPGNICGSLSKAILSNGDDHAYLDVIIRVLEGGKLEMDTLGPADQVMLEEALHRVRIMGEHMESLNARLLIDAEYTYLNPALRLVSIAMMLCYNKKRPLVAYTYQNYLKQTWRNLQADEDLVRSRGACFGAKIVRGAYMLSERALARTKGYPDPIHDTYDDTTRMYNKSMEYLLEKISRASAKYFVMIASHNESTVKHVVNIMEDKGIRKDSGSVFFGQSFGMCDYLSSTLGHAGYLVYKSIPYGPIESCIPYLHRRAMENSSVLGATEKERVLLKKTFMDRLTGSYRRKQAT